MKASLGISSRKIVSIMFLLATLFLSLILSGIPMLISTSPSTSSPINLQEGMVNSKPYENPLPNHVVVQEQAVSVPPLPKYTKQSTKVFDQVFGLMEPGDKFRVIHNF